MASGPVYIARGRGLFMRVRARPLSKPRWDRRSSLLGRSSNLASKHNETREQGCDCPRNKRTILGYPLQHGERDGEWELRTAASAGQSFALSGHMATRRAQTSAPEARMGLLPEAPGWWPSDGRLRGAGGSGSAILKLRRRRRSAPMRQRPRPDDCSACAVARLPGPLDTNTAGRLRPPMRPRSLIGRPPEPVGCAGRPLLAVEASATICA
jgi:hypothetical protein